ncbi:MULTISPECIES: hypothetical protein [unclassified Inquilinus]|uniref:hypothetical protein n=1 Tax=unclassified Inquilinus TaxID=2645927 RepID=UPI003F908C5F
MGDLATDFRPSRMFVSSDAEDRIRLQADSGSGFLAVHLPRSGFGSLQTIAGAAGFREADISCDPTMPESGRGTRRLDLN